jgi:hypothetical protein
MRRWILKCQSGRDASFSRAPESPRDSRCAPPLQIQAAPWSPRRTPHASAPMTQRGGYGVVDPAVSFAGPAPESIGLDQINIYLPGDAVPATCQDQWLEYSLQLLPGYSGGREAVSITILVPAFCQPGTFYCERHNRPGRRPPVGHAGNQRYELCDLKASAGNCSRERTAGYHAGTEWSVSTPDGNRCRRPEKRQRSLHLRGRRLHGWRSRNVVCDASGARLIGFC